MHVLLFYQYFATNNVAGTTRPYELGRRLLAYGDSVTVVSGNYSYLGENLSQVQFLWKYETVDGMPVVRIRMPFGRSRRMLPRMLAFLWFVPIGFIAALTVAKPDLIVASSTPLTIGLPAFCLGWVRRVPFVLELRDLWPDCAIDWDIVRNGPLVWAASWLEMFLYRHSAAIIALSEGIQCQVVRKGIHPTKVSVVTNASDLELFTPGGHHVDLKAMAGMPRNAFVCIHAGSLGLSNYGELLIEAAGKLRNAPSIQFVLMGAGLEKLHLMQEIERQGLQNVHLFDPVPKMEVPSYLRSADIGLVFIKPGVFGHIFLPNKVFDYLACGCPVVLNFDGEARRYIESAEAGVYVSAMDATMLADTIRRLAVCPDKVQRMGKQARMLAETTFSWDHKAVQFRKTLSATLRARKLQKSYASENGIPIVKRMFDWVLAVVALGFLSGPLVIISILVRVTSRGPILYRQQRAGLRGRPFSIIKFRTMTTVRPGAETLADRERITWVGNFLRSTSLDELPQLINVLKGDMSVVGPRPWFLRYLPYYSERERRRHDIRPGITGWAQVNGRNRLAWNDRLELDIWYVDNWSLLLDLRIVLLTVRNVLKRQGVAVDSQSEEPDLDVERAGMGVAADDVRSHPNLQLH